MAYVLKFGGTSLQNARHIGRAADIVEERVREGRTIVVVSAMGGVTNRLIELADLPPSRSDSIDSINESLLLLHSEVLEHFGLDTESNLDHLGGQFRQLRSLTENSDLEPEARRDAILSFGERLSAFLFARVLSGRDITAEAYEAHRFVRTDDRFGEANVDFGSTRRLIREYFEEANGHVPVITGFIGSEAGKRVTTLGRSGSDYTAGLVAEALGAARLEIWTDVDGVLTADPQIVPSAETLGQLNYDDIEELARHGAKVVHPKTVGPLRELKIPLQVKNSFNPGHPGTLITADYPSNGNFRSVSVSGPYALVHFRRNADDAWPLWVESLRHRAELADTRRRGAAESLELVVNNGTLEQAGLLDRMADSGIDARIEPDLVELKLFINGLTPHSPLRRRILQLLAEHDIHPLKDAWQSGQRYLSFFVRQPQARTAARLVNDHICLNRPAVNLFLAGVGAIGSTLLDQLSGLESNEQIKIIGACNSRRLTWDERGLEPGHIRGRLEQGEATRWDDIVQRLKQPERSHTLFVDATGSEEAARRYPELLEAGVHIATPSKLANTFEQSFFDRLMAVSDAGSAHYEFETTVGAGLPVLQTLSVLRQTGDRIRSIEGVASGSLNYIFSRLAEGASFSEAVAEAKQAGYTEPDPRDDLSGEDVARKFLILARLAGYRVEREQLEVESLIPEALRQAGAGEFLEGLERFDESWKERVEAARAAGKVLRYTGSLQEGKIRIGVQEVETESDLGRLAGTDNLFRFLTDRYHNQPLVIKGPGAGKGVTAAGLLGDILKISTAILR